jgi:putative addiction module antidote
MHKEIKLQKVGGSTSATLPKAMLERHQIEAGDRVFAVDTDQGILITPYDPDFAEGMAIAEQVSRKYRNALRELAK